MKSEATRKVQNGGVTCSRRPYLASGIVQCCALMLDMLDVLVVELKKPSQSLDLIFITNRSVISNINIMQAGFIIGSVLGL
jgi:hypothetical protein